MSDSCRAKSNLPSLIVGRHPVIEQLEANPAKVERIYISSTAQGAEIQKIFKLAHKYQIPFYKVPLAKIHRLTRKNHQGVVAYGALVHFYDVEQVIISLYELSKVPLICVLDAVEDVGNVGAIARTAWTTGFHALVFPFKQTPPLQDGAIKASAGTLQKIHLCRSLSFNTLIPSLQYHGINVVSAAAAAAKKVSQVNFTQPSAIIVGNEHSGVRSSIKEQCDEVCSLPMIHSSSYNVSVAFGMVAYEVIQQRTNNA